MAEDNVNTYHDEDTLRKVYEGLMAAGIFGQTAVDAVNQIQNRGILFRERKPKRRGRPPKSETPKDEKESSKFEEPVVTDAWTPKDGEVSA